MHFILHIIFIIKNSLKLQNMLKNYLKCLIIKIASMILTIINKNNPKQYDKTHELHIHKLHSSFFTFLLNMLSEEEFLLFGLREL